MVKKGLLLSVSLLGLLLVSCGGTNKTDETSMSNTTSFDNSTTFETTSSTNSSEQETTTNQITDSPTITTDSTFVEIGEHDPSQIEQISFEEAKAIAFTKIDKQKAYDSVITISESTQAKALSGLYKYTFNQSLDRTKDSLYLFSSIKETVTILSKKTIDLVFKNENNSYTYLTTRTDSNIPSDINAEEAETVVDKGYQVLFNGVFIQSFMTQNTYLSKLNFFVTNNTSIIVKVKEDISYETYKLSSGSFTFGLDGLLSKFSGSGSFVLIDEESKDETIIPINASGEVFYNLPLDKKTSI